MMRRFLAAGFIVAALGGVRAQEPEPVSLQLLLGRAAWYVEDFIWALSNVVSEEEYFQESSANLPAVIPTARSGIAGMALGQLSRRWLKSDFLLVRNHGAFEPFRDVFEVDDVPVRDREERLTKLFLNPSPDGLAQAQRIRQESARYNLGSILRTINNPILPLSVLKGDQQQRFRFTLRKEDPAVAPRVWIIEFKEEASPTLIQGRAGANLFSHGRVWIEASSGRLMKSEMSIEQPELRAQVTTTYRRDDHFAIDVPFRMDEKYQMERGRTLTATATYGRFRRFGVTTEEQLSR